MGEKWNLHLVNTDHFQNQRFGSLSIQKFELIWPQSTQSWIGMIGGRTFWNAVINKGNAFWEMKCSYTLMHKSSLLLNMMKYLNKIQMTIPLGSSQIYQIYRIKPFWNLKKKRWSGIKWNLKGIFNATLNGALRSGSNIISGISQATVILHNASKCVNTGKPLKWAIMGKGPRNHCLRLHCHKLPDANCTQKMARTDWNLTNELLQFPSFGLHRLFWVTKKHSHVCKVATGWHASLVLCWSLL